MKHCSLVLLKAQEDSLIFHCTPRVQTNDQNTALNHVTSETRNSFGNRCVSYPPCVCVCVCVTALPLYVLALSMHVYTVFIHVCINTQLPALGISAGTVLFWLGWITYWCFSSLVALSEQFPLEHIRADWNLPSSFFVQSCLILAATCLSRSKRSSVHLKEVRWKQFNDL